MVNVDCSTEVLQELMHMLRRFISDHGLSEFVLYGLKKDVVIDLGAMRGILEETYELRRLSIKNMFKVHPESLGELITMIGDLIQFHPPRLTELDFGWIGGSAEQGSQILQAIYEAEIQIKRLHISDNTDWILNMYYSELLCGILS